MIYSGRRIVYIPGDAMRVTMPASAGITYLLRDEFTDTLPAGSVNGTAATPGPGTRTVVDTNNIISVGSGVVTINGTPATNDRLVYGGQTRTAGRFLKVKIASITAVGTNNIRIGWTSNATTASGGLPGIDINSVTAVRLKDNVSFIAIASLGTLPATVAFVLKTTGGYIFIRRNGTWYLEWITQTDTTSTVYPKIIASGISAVNMSFDESRIPDVLWLPTPLCYDTFTRANGALGSSETSGPDGQVTAARVWTEQRGTWAISSSKMIPATNDGSRAIATVDVGTTNYQAIFSGTVGNTFYLGISAKYVDVDNRISFIGTRGGNFSITKIVGGVSTELATGTFTYSANANFVVTSDGTSYRFYYNNLQLGTAVTISDAVFTGVTTVGVITNDLTTPATADNFLVFPRGNGGEYAALDLY